MEIIIGWVLLSIVVGVAANTRGRPGGGWFFLALIISPLIAGLLVLAMPNLKTQAPVIGPARADDAFVPDGVLAGFPYRANKDGSVEAIMQGARVQFRNVEAFTAAVGAPK